MANENEGIEPQADAVALAEIEPIEYTPTVWQDGEDGGTPINAANLNNIENAIVALVERTTMQVITNMIADGAVTKEKLEQSLRESITLTPFLWGVGNYRSAIVPLGAAENGDQYRLDIEYSGVLKFQKKAKGETSFEDVWVK